MTCVVEGAGGGWPLEKFLNVCFARLGNSRKILDPRVLFGLGRGWLLENFLNQVVLVTCATQDKFWSPCVVEGCLRLGKFSLQNLFCPLGQLWSPVCC